MADNITLNTGSGGSTLSTDEVTRATVTQHVQYVKLMNGTDGAIDVIPGDATNGLTVNLGSNNDVTVTGTVTVDGSGVTQPVSDGGGSLTVDGTVSVSGEVDVTPASPAANAYLPVRVTDGSSFVSPGSEYVEDDAAAANPTGTAPMLVRTDTLSATTVSADGDNIAARAASTGAQYVEVTAGTTKLGDATNGLLVNLGANNDVTVTGTVTANLAAGTNTNEVVGDVAHDAAASGNPVGISGVAQTMDDTAPPNRVSAEGDATRLATSLDGSVFAHPHGPQVWSYHSDGSTALTDASVHAAPGAGLSLYVTDIVISSGAATAMNAFFEEGASKVLGPYYLEAVAGRGLSIHFQTPKKITANTALTVTTSAAIAHCVDVTGYTAPA